MSDKLRDALADRLEQEWSEAARQLPPSATGKHFCRFVASRLLESRPEERELASLIASTVLKELVNDKTGRFTREGWADIFARFLRQHIAGWVE